MPLAQALTNVAIGKITPQLNEAMLKKQVILMGYGISKAMSFPVLALGVFA